MTRRRSNGEGHVSSRPDARGYFRGYVSLGYGMDGKEKRRWVYDRSRRVVAEKVRALTAELDRGLPVADKRIKLADYLTEWLKTVAAETVRPSTLVTYEYHSRLYLIPALGRYNLEELSPRNVQALVAYLREKGLSSTYIRYSVGVLSSALSQAERWDLVHRNVAKLVRVPRIETAPRERTPLTIEQARALLTSIEGHRLYPLFAVAIALGLRNGELCGLHWADVDLEAGTLTVRYSLQRVSGKLTLGVPKTRRSARELCLPTSITETLRQHRQVQLFERKAAGAAWQEQDFVFTTRAGRPLEPGFVLKTLRKMLQAAGLPAVTVHDLRHTAASLMFSTGLNLKDVSEALGHSNIQITGDLYVHAYESGRRRVADAMDALLTGTGD
jgi:integrase